jgi:hypothetical protein
MHREHAVVDERRHSHWSGQEPACPAVRHRRQDVGNPSQLRYQRFLCDRRGLCRLDHVLGEIALDF